jgi:hypothetical protein
MTLGMTRRSSAPAQPEEPSSPILGVDPLRHPTLAALLEGPHGNHLRREIEDLFGRSVRTRAPRRRARNLVRLKGDHYDEVVQLRDVSSSGVRLLLRGDVPMDLRDLAEMTLLVRLKWGITRLAVSAVRFCGRDGDHFDLAFRFTEPNRDLREHLDEIRSYIFDLG